MTGVRRFLIREAASADSDRLTEIFRAARAASFPNSPIRADRIEDFLRETEGELVLVALDSDARIQGWMSIWQPKSFIHHLYVDPLVQRQGAGRSLLMALPRWVSPPYTLKCLRANATALGYYIRNGWTEIGSGVDAEEGEYALLEWRENVPLPRLVPEAPRVPPSPDTGLNRLRNE